MRGGSKTLALVALLLLVGLAGCGGGDGSDSTAAQAGAGGSGESTTSGGTAKKGDANKGDGEGKSGSSGEQQTPDPGDASEFKPKHHTDSGGGAEKLKVKGGDNSVQEFGAEADTSEFEAAAAVLHNFLDARAEGNWAAVCQYLSKSTIESFEKLAAHTKGGDTSCGATLAGITNPNAQAALKAEAEKADVGSLRAEGGQAFLIYTTDGTILAMPMADEAGTWKVAGLAGTPLN